VRERKKKKKRPKKEKWTLGLICDFTLMSILRIITNLAEDKVVQSEPIRVTWEDGFSTKNICSWSKESRKLTQHLKVRYKKVNEANHTTNFL
jgi:hypothetical protein